MIFCLYLSVKTTRCDLLIRHEIELLERDQVTQRQRQAWPLVIFKIN